MKARTKTLLNYALILGTLLIVLIIGLRGQELTQMGDVLRAISPVSLLSCLGAWAVFTLMDALSLKHFLSLQGHRISLLYAIFVSIAGYYYSNVTPGASGGQPMQVYYLRKKDVPVGIGTSTVIMQFFSFQLMLAVAGTVLWFVYRDFIVAQVQDRVWMLAVGYAVNLIGVLLAALMALHRGLVGALGRFGVFLGTKLRLIKKPEALLAKWNEHTQTFHDSIRFLVRHPASFLWLMLLATLKLAALMAAVPLVYRALNLQGVGAAQLMTLGVMLHLTAAYIPLPGASGAQEGGFSMFFRGLFTDGTLLVGMLLWRFFTYYLFLIIGAITLTIHTARSEHADGPEPGGKI